MLTNAGPRKRMRWKTADSGWKSQRFSRMYSSLSGCCRSDAPLRSHRVARMWWRRSKTSSAEVREKILASKPIRRADATLNASRVTIPVAARRGLLFRIPEGATKTFELDAMGLFVWNRCDGATTVRQIIEEFAENFGIDRDRAEASTLEFLNLLAGRALVARKVESG